VVSPLGQAVQQPLDPLIQNGCVRVLDDGDARDLVWPAYASPQVREEQDRRREGNEEDAEEEAFENAEEAG